MKGFYGAIVILGLLFAGSDGQTNAVYIVNTLAAACFLAGVAGLLREIRRKE